MMMTMLDSLGKAGRGLAGWALGAAFALALTAGVITAAYAAGWHGGYRQGVPVGFRRGSGKAAASIVVVVTGVGGDFPSVHAFRSGEKAEALIARERAAGRGFVAQSVSVEE